MGRFLISPPTAEQVTTGELKFQGRYSGPDLSPEPSIEQTGPDLNGYVFREDAQTTLWEITHSLHYYPTVTLQGIPGAVDEVVEVEHLSVDALRLHFTAPTQGVAWLSRGEP